MSDQHDLLLLTQIAMNDWLTLKAMVPPALPDGFLDLVFETAQGSVRLTGKAHSLKGTSEEVFSLAIYEHRKEGWWKETQPGRTKWQPRDLGKEWSLHSFGSMLSVPRDAKLYSSDRLKGKRLEAASILDDCVAIEFVKIEGSSGGQRTRRIVVMASDNRPCGIEVCVAPEGCEAMLLGLRKLTVDLLSPRSRAQ